MRHRAVFVKFSLAISKDEQLRRFPRCGKVAFKSFKFTDEDWGNRKTLATHDAIYDMVQHLGPESRLALCSRSIKNITRIQVLKRMCQPSQEQARRRPNATASTSRRVRRAAGDAA